MRKRPRWPARSLCLALIIALNALAAPALAQEEDNVATLDWVQAESFAEDCEETAFGTACYYRVDATLQYKTPVLPAVVHCTQSGNSGIYHGDEVDLPGNSGTVIISVTYPNRHIVGGGDATPGTGCNLQAEDIDIWVSQSIPHAETQVEAEAAPVDEAAPEGEPEDLGSLIESGFLDVLAGGATETYTKEELEAYWRARGPACGEPDTPDKDAAWRDCISARPGADIARGIVAEFSEDIGVLDEARGDEAENKAIDAIRLTAGLIVEIDHLQRPMFPAVRAGADNIYLLAKQVVDDPGAPQRAEQYLNLLIRMDIDRGQHLAEPGNN